MMKICYKYFCFNYLSKNVFQSKIINNTLIFSHFAYSVLKPGENPKNISNEEWKKRLNSEQYAVCREKATEMPFTGEFNNHNEKGTFICVCCGNELFESDTKFQTHCGWPGFHSAINENTSEKSVIRIRDDSHGMERIEVICSKCDAHLGHVFSDGPKPTGERFCINSIALKFKHRENK